MKYLELRVAQKQTKSWTLKMNSTYAKKPQICLFCVPHILLHFELKICTRVHYVSRYMCIHFQNFLKLKSLNFEVFK